MSLRRDRRSFLVAIALLGAVFFAIGSILERRDAKQRAAPPLEPAWRSADRSGALLEHQLRSLAPGDSAALRHVTSGVRFDELADFASTPTAMRMIRSLSTGHEFEADLVLAIRGSGTGRILELSVKRPGQDSVRLRVEVRGGVIATIEQAVGAPPEWREWTGAEDLPLALGDLDLEEVLELGQSLAQDGFQPVGFLAGMGARTQLVLASRFEPETAVAAPAGEQPESPARGVRALAYVDSATCELRSVRVLDSKDYVVRVYEDLAWERTRPRLRLVELRVTSIPSNSHTVFRRLE